MSKGRENFLQTQKNFQDFCYLPNFLLSSFDCAFQSESRSLRSTLLRKCYFCLGLTSHLYIFTFIAKATLHMLMEDDFELSLLLRIISGFSYAFFAALKCMAFCWNTKHYKEIFEALKEIYPKTREEKLIYRVRSYFWPNWILLIIHFYLGATAFIVCSPLLESIILYIVNFFKEGWTRAEFGYSKLYEIEYSFDHHGLFPYLLTYSIELLHAHFAIVFNLCGDIWLLCFTMQLCMHFDNIGRRLVNYEPNENEFGKDQEFIGELVKRHQTILKLAENLNKSFALMLFLELMSIAASLCCIGIYSLTQGLGRELIQYAAFLPTIIGQYFLICYYGQQLIMRSYSVAEAAYNNSWYNGSRSYKKSIFIILLRAQKEAEFNALGLQPICLEAFKMLMGATYRVFTLLRETML